MSGGGKDISAQLSRLLPQALDQSGDDEGATEETKTFASGENSQSPLELEGSGGDASKDTTDKGQYLFVFFFGGDGTEFKIDLTKAIDAGAVGRIACKPAPDVLDRNDSGPQKPDTTTCAGTATSESTASSKQKRRHPKHVESGSVTTTCAGTATGELTALSKPKRRQTKQIESGPAEHIGSGWTYKTYQRMNGATEGQTDTYWFSPVLNKKFRSRKEIDRFLMFHDKARSTLITSGMDPTVVDSINGGLLESTAWEQFRTASSSCSNDKNTGQVLRPGVQGTLRVSSGYHSYANVPIERPRQAPVEPSVYLPPPTVPQIPDAKKHMHVSKNPQKSNFPDKRNMLREPPIKMKKRRH